MPADLLARLDAAKLAAEDERVKRAEQTDAGRITGAIHDLRTVTDLARELAEIVIAHVEIHDLAASVPAEAVKRVDLAIAALDDDEITVGEDAQALANRVQREWAIASATISTGLQAQRAAWIGRQPRPNPAFSAVFATLAPEEMKATQDAASALDTIELAPIDSPQAVARLAVAVKGLRDSYLHLIATTPTDVQEFLSEVPNGIALSRVPSQVLSWLREEAVDGAFTITLRST